jgi:general stress protein 26
MKEYRMPTISSALKWMSTPQSETAAMMTSPPDPATLEEIQQFIAQSTMALLTTTDQQGLLHSRPVEAPALDADGLLWFYSSAGDPLLREVQRRPEVQLTCVEGGSGRCMVVNGLARAQRDAVRALAGWKPTLATLFPGGPHDPSLALVNVRVVTADLWD